MKEYIFGYFKILWSTYRRIISYIKLIDHIFVCNNVYHLECLVLVKIIILLDKDLKQICLTNQISQSGG